MQHATRIEDEPNGLGAAGNLMNDNGHLEVLTSAAAVERLTARLLEHSNEVTGRMKILEAGCGRRWELDLERADFELTGVDLDPHALEHRRSVTQDLDVGIVGSICDRDIVPAKQYDVVYSAYVLEHIDGALTALENFTHWVNPGGLIIMSLPNRDSVYGWTARHSPYWFHVWVYRYLFGDRNAGKPGYSPYPTYHDPVLAPSSLRAFCREHDFSLQELFAVDTFSGRRGAKSAAARTWMRVVSRLSRGRLADREVDLGVVMRKPLSF